MRTCQIQVDIVLVCAMTITGCGGDASVPAAPSNDATSPILDAASEPDACSCQADSLAERIYYRSWSREIYYLTVGVLMGCITVDGNGQVTVNGELLGGSCALENGPDEQWALIVEDGPWWYHTFPRDSRDELGYLDWGSSWRTTARDDRSLFYTSVACLLPPAEGTTCQREMWISYNVETSLLSAQTARDLRVSCPQGVMVGGGCTVKPEVAENVQVIRSGFASDNRDEWLCSWANHEEIEQAEVMSVAYCLHEDPLPAECGCCPSVADSIVIKREDAPLRFGANRIEVSCDDGQILMLGNCTIDAEDITPFADVTMFRDGFPPTPDHPDGDRSRWGCSWYNPTGMTPRAIATALCLPAE